MPTLHSALSGADLHEVKGAAGASAGQVYRADGGGSAAFVTPTLLTNIQVANTLSNSNTSSINPSVVDTPITAGFDATVSNGDIVINSSGLITLQTAGLYFMTINCNIGRSTATGTAIVATRLLINGSQFGFTQAASLVTNTSSRPVQFNILRSFSALDTIQVQLMRDSAGTNDGGFISQPITTASWADGPSFFIRISKILGGA